VSGEDDSGWQLLLIVGQGQQKLRQERFKILEGLGISEIYSKLIVRKISQKSRVNTNIKHI